MIAKINLLPWREEYRQHKKLEFFKLAGAVIVAGLLVVGVWDRIVTARIDNQNSRNQVLNQKISELDAKVKEIAALKERRQQLLDRMTVIQALQANRPEIVRVFDEMAVSIPDGVFLTSLNRRGSEIQLSGYAESNNRVSAYMRNLDQSYKFKDPSLTKVQANDLLGEQGNTFEMRVKITEPKVIEETDANEDGKGA